MEQFYPPFPEKALTPPWLQQEDLRPKKTTQLCNPAMRRHLSPLQMAVETDGYSQGGTSMGSPCLTSWGTDQTWTCTEQPGKAWGLKGR